MSFIRSLLPATKKESETLCWMGQLCATAVAMPTLWLVCFFALVEMVSERFVFRKVSFSRSARARARDVGHPSPVRPQCRGPSAPRKTHARLDSRSGPKKLAKLLAEK